jgi:hypothetical protein
MKEAVEIDSSLFENAHILPDQKAWRKNKKSKWIVE